MHAKASGKNRTHLCPQPPRTLYHGAVLPAVNTTTMSQKSSFGTAGGLGQLPSLPTQLTRLLFPLQKPLLQIKNGKRWQIKNPLFLWAVWSGRRRRRCKGRGVLRALPAFRSLNLYLSSQDSCSGLHLLQLHPFLLHRQKPTLPQVLCRGLSLIPP